jgi:hypothetical protein
MRNGGTEQRATQQAVELGFEVLDGLAGEHPLDAEARRGSALACLAPGSSGPNCPIGDTTRKVDGLTGSVWSRLALIGHSQMADLIHGSRN